MPRPVSGADWQRVCRCVDGIAELRAGQKRLHKNGMAAMRRNTSSLDCITVKSLGGAALPNVCSGEG